METLNIVIIFVLGLILGSFLNVVIIRYDQIATILTGRSHCVKCRRNLRWYDLIPVISFLLLGGRCRYCSSKISWQYPLVELGTAVVLAALYYRFSLSLEFVFYGAIFLILAVIFVYDLKKMLIPEALSYAAIVLWILYLLIKYVLNFNGDFVLSSLFGALIMGGFITLLVVVSRERWMGAGDIKLAFLLGAMVFWPDVLFLLFSSFVLGGLFGVALLVFKFKKLKDALPFAPFLIFGAFLTLLFGSQLVQWYIGGLLI